jgi:4-amino-4-deoxy-L-arabinose transferase-like glycosyltransferase
MAREMVEGGDWLTLRWQGEPQFPRPPLSVWALAVGRVIAGAAHPEAAVRWPIALAVGLELVLVALLGARLARRSPTERPRIAVGLVAAGVLLGCDLVVGYARYAESEPFLCVCIIGAALAWEHARERPNGTALWGALVGAALMTKQLIGGIALLWPIVDAIWARATRTRQPIATKRLALGLSVAALVWLPWHVVALARHGGAFVQSYFVESVLRRGTHAILHLTRPSYYLRELWRSEGIGAILFAAALVGAIVAIVRRDARGRASAIVLAWALVPFALFTASASRYDHYPLLYYPALALAVALAVDALPIARTLRAATAIAVVALGIATHTIRDLAAPFAGADELRELAAVANLHRPRTVFLFNLHPYATRVYLDREIATRTLVESERDLREGEAASKNGQPVALTLAPDPIAHLRAAPPPSLLILPRARASLAANATDLTPIVATQRYLLLAPHAP